MEEVGETILKGTGSRLLTPMMLYIAYIVCRSDKSQKLKGHSVNKVHFNFSAFTRYFTCKGPASFQVCSTFQGKCVVNAVNFMCDLYTSPLINLIYKGRRTMLNPLPHGGIVYPIPRRRLTIDRAQRRL